MGLQFHETAMGKRFIEVTMPKIAKGIEKNNTLLEEQNNLLKQNNELLAKLLAKDNDNEGGIEA